MMNTLRVDIRKIKTKIKAEAGTGTGTEIEIEIETEIEERKRSIRAAMKTVKTIQTKKRSRHTEIIETMIKKIVVADEAKVEAEVPQKARSIIRVGVQVHLLSVHLVLKDITSTEVDVTRLLVNGETAVASDLIHPLEKMRFLSYCLTKLF